MTWLEDVGGLFQIFLRRWSVLFPAGSGGGGGAVGPFGRDNPNGDSLCAASAKNGWIPAAFLLAILMIVAGHRRMRGFSFTSSPPPTSSR